VIFPVNDAEVPESAPEIVNAVSVPTLVICVCDAFTERVEPVLVRPVPAVRYPRESTYVLVVKCPDAVGVAPVTVPVNVAVAPESAPEIDKDVNVPTDVI